MPTDAGLLTATADSDDTLVKSVAVNDDDDTIANSQTIVVVADVHASADDDVAEIGTAAATVRTDDLTVAIERTDVVTTADVEDCDDDDVLSIATDDVNEDTCPFGRAVDVVTSFLPATQPAVPSLFMVPSAILDGSAPRVVIKIRSREFPAVLDSGAEVSVLPQGHAQSFQPPVSMPAVSRQVMTFGSPNVTLQGPVLLEVSLCGVQVLHPFYFIDADVPPIVGYDLMQVARLVVDVGNRLVWSRFTPASSPAGPNPPVSVPDVSVHTCVSFVQPCQSESVEVESSLPATVVDVPLPASVPGHVEPASTSSSSVVSRQISVVCPHPGRRASTLNPAAPLFRPRANSTSAQGARRLYADPSSSYCLPVYPLVDPNETLVKLPPHPGSIFSVTPSDSDTSVPPHLQELFDETISHAKLSMSHQQSLAALLRRHGDVFATGPTDLGFCAVLQHDINTGNAAPIKQSPRRPPMSARDAEDDILDEMLETGVIEPSNSPWSSPVCMVKKKDGTFRFCIDYRRVNEVTIKDAFPVPDVQDALDSLRGSKYFATIDLLSGYWQLGMTERAKERSAFCTRRGLYHFTRMPFGLSNAPSSFCRLMSIIFKDMLYVQCIVYLDDIVVYASSPEQLLERLDAVLGRLQRFGLKAKPSKCVFFKSPIEFLGHLVSEDGIEPLPSKLDTIRDWPTPHCLRDVRAFYGLASYYRKFVRDFAAIAEPLSRLTKKNAPFQWTEETQQSFDRLKRALVEAGTLAFPYPDIPCILDTDASDVAMGAVLSQVIDGVERPIAFFSRVLNGAQRNYCPTRRELLAVVAALQHFRHYLLGAHVILRTDHHSLKWLRTFKRPEGILARWIETLAEYDYTIEHRPGRLHCNADAVSRQTCKQCWGKIAPSHWIDECERSDDLTGPLSIRALRILPELTEADVACLQAEDTELGDAYRVLHDRLDLSPDELRSFPLESRQLLSMRPQVRLEKGVLVKADDDRTRLVVPSTLRRRLFDQTHAGPTAAHLGARKTAGQLKESYFWNGLRTNVAEWCRQCSQCSRSKGPPLRPHGELHKIPVGAPLDLVTMDVLSGLPTASDGSKYILVLVDGFTKWVEAYALPDQEAATCVTAAYNGFFSRFGLPRQLHSDQGRNFEASLVKELCALAGIHKTRTTPFHPRSDGLTERANRTLLRMLRSTTEDSPSDWPSKLPSVLSAYRMTTHATTRVTPNMAMLGREVILPCTFIAGPPDDTTVSTNFVANFRDTLRDAHQRVREALSQSAKTEKRYFDKRVKYQPFSVGQLVWLYWPRPLIRTSQRKLVKLWTGPWEILSFLSPLVVQIRCTTTQKRQTVHVDRLVPCVSELNTVVPSVEQSVSTVQPEHQTDTAPTDTSADSSPLTSLSISRSGRRISKPARYC